MKKQLLALSLITAPGLVAQGNSGQMQSEQNNYCNRCSCTPCCCCVPKPKKCIDCECYTPQYYDLQCDCGFFVDVEFLYWYAKETNLDYGLQFTSVPKDPDLASSELVFAPRQYESLDTKWDPGFRVGLGWNMECDGWDLYLTWTYMHNKEKDSTSVDPSYALNTNSTKPGNGQSALINSWINASFHPNGSNGNSGVLTFDKITGNWRLNFNSIDLELGRKYWLSPCFTLRPYAGLRGMWTKTTWRTNSQRNVTAQDVTNTAVFKDKFVNRNWGVGFLGGIQPTWYFCGCFGIYSNMDFALVWGEFEEKKDEFYVDATGIFAGTVTGQTINYSNSNAKNSIFRMAAIFDVAIGLRWEDTWCCDRYRTTLDLGWEHHYIPNYNQRHKTVDFAQGETASDPNDSQVEGFRTTDVVNGDLGLGGLVIRLRFDF